MRHPWLILAILAMPISSMAQPTGLTSSAGYKETMDFVIAQSNQYPHTFGGEKIESPEDCKIFATWGVILDWENKGRRVPVQYQFVDLRYIDGSKLAPVFNGLRLQCRQAGCIHAGTQYRYEQAHWKVADEATLRFRDEDRATALSVLSHLISICASYPPSQNQSLPDPNHDGFPEQFHNHSSAAGG
jgi:hypothetical protein